MTYPYDSPDTYDGLSAGSVSTATDWFNATRGLLLSGLQAERNTLAADYQAGDGVLQFTSTPEGIVGGIRLSVGLNTFYVLSVNTSGATAAVYGGQEGTTDAFAAAGTIVRIAPRFTDHEILRELNGDLSSLSSPDNGLYQVKTATLTYSNSRVGYDLAGVSDLIDIIDVRVATNSGFADWPRLGQRAWRLDRAADTAVFPSGLALQVFDGGYSGQAVRIVYRAPFTPLSSEVSDVATTGLPPSAWDLPPWGAALRLMAPREIKARFTESQPDTRRATEVPPGAVLGSYRGIAALRAQRINEEKARLTASVPPRRW